MTRRSFLKLLALGATAITTVGRKALGQIKQVPAAGGWEVYGFLVMASDGSGKPFQCRLVRKSTGSFLMVFEVNDGGHSTYYFYRGSTIQVPDGDDVRFEFDRTPSVKQISIVGGDKFGQFRIEDGVLNRYDRVNLPLEPS